MRERRESKWKEMQMKERVNEKRERNSNRAREKDTREYNDRCYQASEIG